LAAELVKPRYILAPAQKLSAKDPQPSLPLETEGAHGPLGWQLPVEPIMKPRLQPSSQGGWYSPPHRVVVVVGIVDVVVAGIVDVEVVDVLVVVDVVVVVSVAVTFPTTAGSVLSVE